LKANKELNSGGRQDDESGRKGNWDSDGKSGPMDAHTSIKILLDWWMAEGNYVRFCGKQNEGVKKISFCNMLADKMSKETSSKRNGKNVLSKIQHIQRSFREAHNFAESETGAGILENDGETTFENIVKRKCPYYYDIKDIMIDRASTKPKASSYDNSDDDSDDDSDDNSDDENSNQVDDAEAVANINEVGASGNDALSDISDTEEQEGTALTTSTPRSVGTKRTASSSSGKKTKKKQKGKNNANKNPLMDDQALSLLTDASQMSERKMAEMVRHNKMVEEREQKKYELELQREDRERKRAALDAWKGKSDELEYKMKLLDRYKDFREVHGWSDEQILAFCPDMSAVIAAHQPLNNPMHQA
jgi:hypothetical protein